MSGNALITFDCPTDTSCELHYRFSIAPGMFVRVGVRQRWSVPEVGGSAFGSGHPREVGQVANDIVATRAKVERYLDRLVDAYEVTSDLSFTFRRGSTRTFIEVVAHGQDNTVVRLRAVVALAVKPTPALFQFLISREYTFGHLAFAEGVDGATITFNHSLLGEHLDWDEFNWAASTVTLVADELDDVIVEMFGGRRYDEDSARPAPVATQASSPASSTASPSSPAWIPKVDLETARPAVIGLACAAAAPHAQVTAAIAEFVRLSERPTDVARLTTLARTEPDVAQRPWRWLRSVMQAALAAGEPRLACAALYWALNWTFVLGPRLDPEEFIELGIDPIPQDLKAEIAEIGLAATQAMPPEAIIVGDFDGDEDDVVRARAVAELGPMLTTTTAPVKDGSVGTGGREGPPAPDVARAQRPSSNQARSMNDQDLTELVEMIVGNQSILGQPRESWVPGRMWVLEHLGTLTMLLVGEDPTHLRVDTGAVTDVPITGDLALFISALNQELWNGRVYLSAAEGATSGSVILQDITFAEALAWEFGGSVDASVRNWNTQIQKAIEIAPRIMARVGGRPFTHQDVGLLLVT